MASDFTSGFERRRLTVEFNNVPSAAARADWDAQGGEAAVLHREIPGLVNWLLALSREEVTARIMNPPQRAALSNIDALRFGNPIADWLIDNTEPDPKSKVKVGDKQVLPGGGLLNADRWLYPNYLEWCGRTGRKNPVALVRFSRLILDIARILRVNLKKPRDKNGVFLEGLRLIKTDPTTGDLLTLHPKQEKMKGDEGLESNKWLIMMNMNDMNSRSNLNTCARAHAAARSNNHADEDNEEAF